MKNRFLRDSFRHAFRGIYQGFKTEQNFRIEVAAGIFFLLLGVYFSITPKEWLVLVMVIGFVLVAELLNTAIEYTVDMVCKGQYHELAKYAKDIAAGATLIASIAASIVGLIMFLPYVLALIN